MKKIILAICTALILTACGSKDPLKEPIWGADLKQKLDELGIKNYKNDDVYVEDLTNNRIGVDIFLGNSLIKIELSDVNDKWQIATISDFHSGNIYFSSSEEDTIVDYKTKKVVKEGVKKNSTPDEPLTFDDDNTKSSFRKECETNALSYPASVGTSLVTKGENNFTGEKYYFEGTYIGTIDIEDFGNAWLVRNSDGYVMPINHNDFSASPTENDIVKIWGTLTGNGYSKGNIENVVSETGAVIAIEVEINNKQVY